MLLTNSATQTTTVLTKIDADDDDNQNNIFAAVSTEQQNAKPSEIIEGKSKKSISFNNFLTVFIKNLLFLHPFLSFH